MDVCDCLQIPYMLAYMYILVHVITMIGMFIES